MKRIKKLFKNEKYKHWCILIEYKGPKTSMIYHPTHDGKYFESKYIDLIEDRIIMKKYIREGNVKNMGNMKEYLSYLLSLFDTDIIANSKCPCFICSDLVKEIDENNIPDILYQSNDICTLFLVEMECSIKDSIYKLY